jgi:hypothetical protein
MSINELASLLSDAELLFDHERYGRATALGRQPLAISVAYAVPGWKRPGNDLATSRQTGNG